MSFRVNRSMGIDCFFMCLKVLCIFFKLIQELSLVLSFSKLVELIIKTIWLVLMFFFILRLYSYLILNLPFQSLIFYQLIYSIRSSFFCIQVWNFVMKKIAFILVNIDLSFIFVLIFYFLSILMLIWVKFQGFILCQYRSDCFILCQYRSGQLLMIFYSFSLNLQQSVIKINCHFHFLYPN